MHARQDFIFGQGPQDGCQSFGQADAVVDPIKVGRIAWIRPQPGCPDGITKAHELAVVSDRDQDVPIAGLERVIGHDVGMRVAAPIGHLTAGQKVTALVDQPCHLRVHEAQVDMLALARCIAVPQSRQNADGRIHAAHHIRDADAHLHRWAIGRAGQRHDPTIALRHQVIAGLVPVRPRLPKARDGTVHKPRMRLEQRGVVQPVFDQPVRFVIFDHHIGAGGQLADGFLPLLRRDIDGNGLLVAVRGHEIGGEIGFHPVRADGIVWSPAARVIATGLGVFHFDHRRAHIAQQLRGGGTGEDAAQVEDKKPVEGHGRAGHISLVLGMGCGQMRPS
mmetsp:Transcript_23836/g.43098  ORF Transcript_23836/g.43098 Transcript_23836/m.43098 type:complete len:334 (-) Transcript_23836:562-1563(-)